MVLTTIDPAVGFLKNHFRKRCISVLEVGARYGDSSEVIIRALHVSNCTIVDPCECYDDYSNDSFYKILNTEEVFPLQGD